MYTMSFLQIRCNGLIECWDSILYFFCFGIVQFCPMSCGRYDSLCVLAFSLELSTPPTEANPFLQTRALISRHCFPFAKTSFPTFREVCPIPFRGRLVPPLERDHDRRNLSPPFFCCLSLSFIVVRPSLLSVSSPRRPVLPVFMRLSGLFHAIFGAPLPACSLYR